ncbi:MAG TPA: hypothetical protein VLV55_04795 [Rhizomicrobium sp.]|nr:hypothetical protein [Rhizomicrobium sp.]
MSEIEQLRNEAPAYLHKMIIPRDRMDRAVAEANAMPGVRHTPPADLRFIEGIADLPYESVTFFHCIPDAQSVVCKCGREPNAADIVAYALRQNLHSRQTVRDAIIGVQCIFEAAQNGRQAPCLRCARRIMLSGYWRQEYMYV